MSRHRKHERLDWSGVFNFAFKNLQVNHHCRLVTQEEANQAEIIGETVPSIQARTRQMYEENGKAL